MLKLVSRMLLYLVLAAPAAGAQTPDLDRLMRALAARGDAAASFVEEQHLAALDRPLRSSGELSYRAPDAIEKRTLTPRAEALRYADGSVTIERGGRRTHLDLQRYPQVLPFIESIRATLAGDRPALEKLFELTLDGDERDWVLRLVPLDPKTRELVREIRVDGSEADLLRLTVERTNGDRSVTTMTPHPPR
jgi:hypothetical protein